MTQMAGMSTEQRKLMGESARRIASQWGPDRFGTAMINALQSAATVTGQAWAGATGVIMP